MKLKNFTQLNRAELYLVLAWRNQLSTFMKTKNISLQEHLSFIHKLKQDESKKYFLVYKQKDIMGVIDFVNITKSSCEFGLYANPHLKGKGQILLDIIKQYAFENLKLSKLCACVFKENHKALTLYLNNGFYISKEDTKMLYIELLGGGIVKCNFSPLINSSLRIAL
ncbi:UDP-4-amino-4,6-dideoxy-N-acetyl-beta-L-altrosamine N-acetyltransferase [Campylobacter sp. MIT 21-1684]|uniref:UDP-4-amino-4, 6-dideoxy-N-acetyl-beta-L-altrosamine N-acetyltransferase n=1 Tax=Campylobacter sp. MIT 21-1684 TaxID=2994322 RepID=UPI00224B3F43|nr:UDP-4-amino-4,6-dideoxy-N-acetyl-beta-L-altrosamine N-acetyltransferase [Campylobacter sp. MIT 21-1684]MCX2683195.1 UDP-4-amino-4,6-dideoxy-N-acetyl-beta-L-altrosamine N-acetyltransferase [Campylobacter sp. MIT 21-1684]